MRDRDLIRHYWPVEFRPAFDALFDLDDALAEIVMTSTQPALGTIRLAWWREALERLDHAPPPPEPRLQAAAKELLPRGVSGVMLASIEDGHAALLDEAPDPERVGHGGSALFAVGASLLGGDHPALAQAGALHALARAIRRGAMAIPDDVMIPATRFPRKLRPLTGFARLAARDLRQVPSIEPEATPQRAAALFSHALFGRVG